VTAHISPTDWDLDSSLGEPASAELEELGLDRQDMELRCRKNTYEWLLRQYSEETGAFHGFYDPRSTQMAESQTANLIAPWQLIAGYDRYGDDALLERACRAADWVEHNLVESHPMSFVLGGIRDNYKPNQLWTKYTADYVRLDLALHRRTGKGQYLERAKQGGRFLVQSQTHGFAPKYDRVSEQWSTTGWQSFGRVVTALLGLAQELDDRAWARRAMAWAEHGVSLQAANGCFHLVHQTYYSSDVAADEMRALLLMSCDEADPPCREAAIRFANWHVDHQRADGSWWVTIDASGVPVSVYVGPGDVPNIAISLLYAHRETGDLRYLLSALRAIHYSMSVQATPDSGDPYLDDQNVLWGFWSWQPYYDYTMSSDQSTHHVRGMWYFLDYFRALAPPVRADLVKAWRAYRDSGRA
jgi:hypothetical protein